MRRAFRVLRALRFGRGGNDAGYSGEKEKKNMADLEQLKKKYSPVINTINSFGEYGAKVEAVDLAGEQLHLKATVPSKVIANRVWDVIKEVDPSYSDLKHEIVTAGGDT